MISSAKCPSPPGAARRPSELILAMITIGLSWAFIHTMFALHYVHEFYAENGERGMVFPGGEEEPDYGDFLYFSLVIGMTSQVSDVAVTSRSMRRLTLVHSVLAFVFNIAVLALSINIIASVI